MQDTKALWHLNHATAFSTARSTEYRSRSLIAGWKRPRANECRDHKEEGRSDGAVSRNPARSEIRAQRRTWVPASGDSRVIGIWPAPPTTVMPVEFGDTASQYLQPSFPRRREPRHPARRSTPAWRESACCHHVFHHRQSICCDVSGPRPLLWPTLGRPVLGCDGVTGVFVAGQSPQSHRHSREGGNPRHVTADETQAVKGMRSRHTRHHQRPKSSRRRDWAPSCDGVTGVFVAGQSPQSHRHSREGGNLDTRQQLRRKR